MENYRIIDSKGTLCHFFGDAVARVETDVLEFSHGHAWMELSGYRSDDRGWVVAIVVKRPANELDDLVFWFATPSLDAAESYLYDFDITTVLPPSPALGHYYTSATTMLISHLRGHETGTLPHRPHSWINRIRWLVGM